MLGEMVESCAPSGCRACSVCSPCTCQMLGRIVLPSILALPFHIALVFLRVLAALLQGAYPHTEKHMRGQRILFFFPPLRYEILMSQRHERYFMYLTNPWDPLNSGNWKLSFSSGGYFRIRSTNLQRCAFPEGGMEREQEYSFLQLRQSY